MSTSTQRNPVTRYWPLAAGVLVTLLVAWFAARELDWRALWASLTGADPRYVALAAAAMALNLALKTWRWQWLLQPQGRAARRGDLLAALLAGQLGNVLLPTRLGDVARIGLVHDRAGVPVSTAVLTLLAEKALDSVLLLALLGALLPAVAWRTWLSTTQVFAGVLLAAGLVGLLWLATRETVRARLLPALRRRLPGPVPEWAERALETLSAWRAVREGRVQVRLWALTAGIWLLAGLVNQFSFRAVGLRLPLTAGLLLAATEIAGTRLAYTPAALGVYHAIAILTLAPFGVAPTEALAAALLVYLIVYLPVLVGGLAALWREGLARIA